MLVLAGLRKNYRDPIRNLVNQADLDEGRRSDGLTSVERDEFGRHHLIECPQLSGVEEEPQDASDADHANSIVAVTTNRNP